MDIIYRAMLYRFIIMILLYKIPIDPIKRIVFILLMDSMDSFYIKYNTNKKWIGCDLCKTWRYQFIDKWLDLLGYYFVYLIIQQNDLLNQTFKNENKYILKILLYSIYYRFVGVLLFNITKKSIYLVIFADLFKEFLIYDVIMKNQPDSQGYIIVFILKILFEYYWHQKYNKKEYKDPLWIN